MVVGEEVDHVGVHQPLEVLEQPEAELHSLPDLVDGVVVACRHREDVEDGLNDVSVMPCWFHGRT